MSALVKSFNLQPENLGDDLVELRPLKKADFEKLYAIASDPLIWEQHPVKDRYKQDVFQIFFDGAIESNGAFLVCDTSGSVIGSTRYYDFKPELSQIAVGYTFLARKCWGNGYNRSMKKLLLDHAFQYVDTVVFQVGSSNIRSQKAIVKIGATKTHELDLDLNGKRILHFEYKVTKAVST